MPEENHEESSQNVPLSGRVLNLVSLENKTYFELCLYAELCDPHVECRRAVYCYQYAMGRAQLLTSVFLAVFAEDSILLGCDVVSFGEQFPTFRRVRQSYTA